MKRSKKKNRLSETTIDFLHLMKQFRKKHDLKDEIIVHLVHNQLGMIGSDLLLCKFV